MSCRVRAAGPAGDRGRGQARAFRTRRRTPQRGRGQGGEDGGPVPRPPHAARCRVARRGGTPGYPPPPPRGRPGAESSRTPTTPTLRRRVAKLADYAGDRAARATSCKRRRTTPAAGARCDRVDVALALRTPERVARRRGPQPARSRAGWARTATGPPTARRPTEALTGAGGGPRLRGRCLTAQSRRWTGPRGGCGLLVGPAQGRAGPGQPDADRGPGKAPASSPRRRAPRVARGTRGGTRTQPQGPDGMIAVVMLLWRDAVASPKRWRPHVCAAAAGVSGPPRRGRSALRRPPVGCHRGGRLREDDFARPWWWLTPTPRSAGRSSTTAAPPTSPPRGSPGVLRPGRVVAVRRFAGAGREQPAAAESP